MIPPKGIHHDRCQCGVNCAKDLTVFVYHEPEINFFQTQPTSVPPVMIPPSPVLAQVAKIRITCILYIHIWNGQGAHKFGCLQIFPMISRVVVVRGVVLFCSVLHIRPDSLVLSFWMVCQSAFGGVEPKLSGTRWPAGRRVVGGISTDHS